jgi:Uma2 family endonuclease
MIEVIAPEHPVTTARSGMALDEFLRENSIREFELINGERKYRMPTVTEHNDSTEITFLSMRAWVTERKLGIVKAEATFTLSEPGDPNWVSSSFTPDVLFIAADRFAAYVERVPDYKRRPYFIVPDMVVEVISPTDGAQDVLDKIEAYFAAGVRLIWTIYPRSRKALIYTPPGDSATILHLNKTPDAALDGGEVLPGFTLRLADVPA